MTIGETWLEYMGVLPDQYERFMDLADEISNEMWDAAVAVLNEWQHRDPVLRVLADDRCGLWEWCTVPAGTLPPGTEIQVTRSSHYGGTETWTGKIREPSDLEHSAKPGEVFAWWTLQYASYGRPHHPFLDPHTEVLAWLPIPFDLSALLAQIEQETGALSPPPPAAPPPLAPVEDLTPGRIIRYWHDPMARRVTTRTVTRRARIENTVYDARGGLMLRIAVLNKDGSMHGKIGRISILHRNVVSVEPVTGDA